MQKLNFKNISRKLSLKGAIFLALAGIIIISQIFTFAQDGEILGIKVRTTKRVTNSSVGAERSDAAAKSTVCSTVSAESVSKLVGVKGLEEGSFYPDIKKDGLVSSSSCIYSNLSEKDAKKVSVTVSLQEKADKELAQAEVTKTIEGKDYKEVSDVNDAAYFLEKSNHLVVRSGSKVVNVFVNLGTTDSKVDIQSVATQISSQLLNE